MLRHLLPFLVLAACVPALPDDPKDVAADADADTDSDSDADTDADSDTDSDTDTDSDADADTTAWGSRMVHIPAGTFTMGGGAGDPEDDYVDHQVTLTHDFWIGATEITRGQWESDSGNAGWEYTSMYPCTTSTTASDCPAASVSWYDVAKYANALSTTEGLTPCYLADGTVLAAAWLTDPYSCPGYRLPTEAEWEYAARAGEDTTYSGSNTSTDVAWTTENAYSVGTYAHEVATLAPNAWGLYDMSGNQWEWTNDWYDPAHGGYEDGISDVDPAGPVTGSGEGNEGSDRVYRGGGWGLDADRATVSYRYRADTDYAYSDIGFRLSRSIVP